MKTQTRKTLSPVKAIRAKCLNCCCDQVNEVRLCPCSDCSLYPYRSGKNPYRKKREYTDEQRALMSDRLLQARLASK